MFQIKFAYHVDLLIVCDTCIFNAFIEIKFSVDLNSVWLIVK